MVMSVYCVE